LAGEKKATKFKMGLADSSCITDSRGVPEIADVGKKLERQFRLSRGRTKKLRERGSMTGCWRWRKHPCRHPRNATGSAQTQRQLRNFSSGEQAAWRTANPDFRHETPSTLRELAGGILVISTLTT